MELKAAALELKNAALELKNMALELKNTALELKNAAPELKNTATRKPPKTPKSKTTQAIQGGPRSHSSSNNSGHATSEALHCAPHQRLETKVCCNILKQLTLIK